MRLRAWVALTSLFPLWAGAALATGGSGLTYVDQADAAPLVIDVRPLATCKEASLPGARCLPTGELVGAQGQLPSERDLLWLLGTAGLEGHETILVAGDSASGRDFVAGLLYLAGQRQVRVLRAALSPLVAQRGDAVSGRERGMIRAAIFTEPMRADLWLVSPREVVAGAILAPDAYTALARFTRHVAGGGQPVRVGWNLAKGNLP
jgi:hypothetical protein